MVRIMSGGFKVISASWANTFPKAKHEARQPLSRGVGSWSFFVFAFFVFPFSSLPFSSSLFRDPEARERHCSASRIRPLSESAGFGVARFRKLTHSFT